MNPSEPAKSTPSVAANWATADVRSNAARPLQFISFAISNDQYGVDIMAVREIKAWSDIAHLPKQPDYVRGVLNLRGVIVPIIDLRCRFGQGLTQATPLHVVIVVQVGSRLVGLLADEVLDIVTFEPGQVQPVPRIAQASCVGFLAGLAVLGGVMIALIDLNNLLAATFPRADQQQQTGNFRSGA